MNVLSKQIFTLSDLGLLVNMTERYSRGLAGDLKAELPTYRD